MAEGEGLAQEVATTPETADIEAERIEEHAEHVGEETAQEVAEEDRWLTLSKKLDEQHAEHQMSHEALLSRMNALEDRLFASEPESLSTDSQEAAETALENLEQAESAVVEVLEPEAAAGTEGRRYGRRLHRGRR